MNGSRASFLLLALLAGAPALGAPATPVAPAEVTTLRPSREQPNELSREDANKRKKKKGGEEDEEDLLIR